MPEFHALNQKYINILIISGLINVGNWLVHWDVLGALLCVLVQMHPKEFVTSCLFNKLWRVLNKENLVSFPQKLANEELKLGPQVLCNNFPCTQYFTTFSGLITSEPPFPLTVSSSKTILSILIPRVLLEHPPAQSGPSSPPSASQLAPPPTTPPPC